MSESLVGYRLRRAWWLARSPLAKVAVVAALPGGAWAGVAHQELVTEVAHAGVGVGIGLAGWAGWTLGEWAVLWRHRRDRVVPLGWAVRHQLRYDDDLPASAFIRWDHDFGEEGTEIRVMLPPHWIGTDDERRKLVRAVTEKGRFADGDIAHRFILGGRFGYLRVTPRPKVVVPQRVRATDPEVRGLLDETTSGHHVLALGPGGEPIRGDLDGKAPHVGVSMPTGEGKSNTIKGIVAQEMHLGASAVILDYKRRSLKCFKGLAGVTYCRDIGEIHNALVGLAREAMQRNVLADELGDDEEPPWQRRIVVMEEQNTTIKRLRRWWEQARESDDPKVSPAVDAYEELLNMGRQVNVHVIAAFQKLTAQAAGGTENRDQFGMVVVSAPKKSVWTMLADGIAVPDVAGKPKGRSWYIHGGRAPEGQAVWWTDRQAREWAASGVSSKVRASAAIAVSLGKRPARRAGSNVLEVVDGGAHSPTAGAGERLYTLREASADHGQGVVPEKFQDLRGKRSGSARDPEFPDPDRIDGQRKLYAAETLQRWSRNREQAG